MSTIRTNNIIDAAGTGSPSFPNGVRVATVVGAGGANDAQINGITPALASQVEAQAGTDNAKLMTALRTAQAIAALGSTTANVLAFTVSGTYTPTAGYTSAVVIATGGGQGGGNVASGGTSSGGGAGRTVISTLNLSGLAAQAVTIGAGGAAGTATGGNTSVGSLVLAPGAGQATAAIGTFLIPGATGGTGITGGNKGATSFWGDGAPSSNSGSGFAATVYGSGGSGAFATSGNSASGGAGAPGVVFILEFK